MWGGGGGRRRAGRTNERMNERAKRKSADNFGRFKDWTGDREYGDNRVFYPVLPPCGDLHHGDRKNSSTARHEAEIRKRYMERAYGNMETWKVHRFYLSRSLRKLKG